VYFVPSFAVLLGAVSWVYLSKGQPITAATFLGVGLVLGAGEGASIYFTGQTISQNHWLMDASDPNAGMVLILLLTTLLLIIVVHLGKITIGKYKDLHSDQD